MGKPVAEHVHEHVHVHGTCLSIRLAPYAIPDEIDFIWLPSSDIIGLHIIGLRHETAGTVVYLAADASSFVTGQVISVDGGVTAW